MSGYNQGEEPGQGGGESSWDDGRKSKFMRLMGGKKGDKPENPPGPPPVQTCQNRPEGAPESEQAQAEGNKWDDNRKDKFMRLMGAKKACNAAKVQHGTRSTDDEAKIQKQLEDQYQQSLQMKLSGAARRHKGLGFAEESGFDVIRQQQQRDRDIREGAEGEDNGRQRERSPLGDRDRAREHRSHDERDRSHEQRERSHDHRDRSHDHRDRSHDQRDRSHDQRDRSHDQRDRSHDQRHRSHDQSERPHEQRDRSHHQQRDFSQGAQYPRGRPEYPREQGPPAPAPPPPQQQPPPPANPYKMINFTRSADS